ncbi:uncharacterized protein LOC121741772 [Salvia splendens]|uniref:uncharacterized protein LOC121741772 n=1 Tax=Salvia splendens TaxID=180675 RepID=UPI001C2588B7|nr:uncharacterized protein LOC121741772 [Salvia splendens]
MQNNACFGLGMLHRPIPEWLAWGEGSDLQVGGSGVNPFDDHNNITENATNSLEGTPAPIYPTSSGEHVPNGIGPIDICEGLAKPTPSQKSVAMPALFEEDVELEGTEKAMEQALKEGIVGEAGPLKRNTSPKKSEKDDLDDSAGMKEYNDTNYWRVDQEVAVSE